MYGLVCENVAAYIKVKHGKDAWENIRRLANIDTPSFSIHQVKLENSHKLRPIYHRYKIFLISKLNLPIFVYKLSDISRATGREGGEKSAGSFGYER